MIPLAFHDDSPPPELSGSLIRWLTDPFGLYRELIEAVREFIAAIAPWVAGVALIFVVFGAVIVALRRWKSAKDSSAARLLQILPPPEVDREGALTLWMALHALIRPRWKRWLFGQPHLVWELFAEGGEASLGMWVPGSIPPGLVERAIESSWPGCRVNTSPNTDLELGDGHLATCEMTLAEPDHFPLGEGTGQDNLRVALGALTLLDPGEKALVQVLARPVTFAGRRRISAMARRVRRQRNASLLSLRPAQARPAYDPVAEQDVRSVLSKAASPLWESVVRIAVSSEHRPAARGKIHALAGAFAVFEGRNWLRPTRMRGGRRALVTRRMGRGFLLAAHELAPFATLPTPEALPALERARARTVAAPRGLPQSGKPLGVSDHPGHNRPVALAIDDARHHIHLIGETGTGKSTMIARMVLADAEAGRAAVVIDPKGDLVTAILDRLPKRAVYRTCVLNPDDSQASVGLNVLQGDDPDLVVDHIVSVFRRIYEHSWGPRTDDIMRAACLTLTEMPGATLAEVPLLLTNREVRNAVRFKKQNYAGLGDLGTFWDWYERLGEQQRAANIAPLMNKIRAFLLRGPVRAMIGQSHPRLNVQKLIESGGLLLVRIPKGTLGEETSRILGAFVVARVWQAAMKRAANPETSRSPISLYVDEMHNYLALPRSFEDMLAEARGYGLSLLLAHQHLGQLPREMREALAANARTKIAFACSPEDSRSLEGFFEPYLTHYDLANLTAFQAACRPCINGGHGSAFTFSTEPLKDPAPDREDEVKAESARRFAISRDKAEGELRLRQSQLLDQNGFQSVRQTAYPLRAVHPAPPQPPEEGPNG